MNVEEQFTAFSNQGSASEQNPRGDLGTCGDALPFLAAQVHAASQASGC